MKKLAGNSLLSVLLFLGLIATLGFAVAGLSVNHLSLISSNNCRQEALNLARSAVSKAIARLMVDPSFGPGQSLTVQLAGTRQGAQGLLFFEPNSLKIPQSVNNLLGTQSVPGSLGGTVPAAQAQLVGIGTSGGFTQRVVAYLAIPPFPYAIASAGPIRAERGVTVGGLASAPTGPVPTSATLLPTSMVSNNSNPEAIFLGANTHVTGDVKATGTVKFDPTAPLDSISVEGAVRSGASPEKIPHIALSDYDPQASNKPFSPIDSDSVSTPLVIGGMSRRQGNFTANNGLKLSGGLLFVDGDLNIRGGVSGKGILVVTGNLKVSGQADLVAGGGVAVLTGKDLSLHGSGSERSYLQGLVYTEGTFQADEVSLVGTLISAGKGSGVVTLKDSRMLQTPVGAISGSGGPSAPTANLSTSNVGTFWLKSNINNGNLNFVLNYSVAGSINSGSQGLSTNFSIPLTSLAGLKQSDTAAQQLAFLQTLVPGMAPELQSGLNDYLSGQFLKDYWEMNSPDPGNQPPGILTVDPSSFLHIQDRIRIVLWDESE